MKKTIELTHPKLKPARLVDSIKHDVKKYLKRERNKPLPKGMDYWTFDCRFGPSAEAAEEIFTSEINKHIDTAVEQELAQCYIEIIVRAANHKPKIDEQDDEYDFDGDDEDFDGDEDAYED